MPAEEKGTGGAVQRLRRVVPTRAANMPDPPHVAAAPLHSHPGCDLQCGAGASQAEQVVCKLNRRFGKGAPAVTFAECMVA